jgi:hypothetical protein
MREFLKFLGAEAVDEFAVTSQQQNKLWHLVSPFTG